MDDIDAVRRQPQELDQLRFREMRIGDDLARLACRRTHRQLLPGCDRRIRRRPREEVPVVDGRDLEPRWCPAQPVPGKPQGVEAAAAHRAAVAHRQLEIERFEVAPLLEPRELLWDDQRGAYALT